MSQHAHAIEPNAEDTAARAELQLVHPPELTPERRASRDALAEVLGLLGRRPELADELERRSHAAGKLWRLDRSP